MPAHCCLQSKAENRESQWVTLRISPSMGAKGYKPIPYNHSAFKGINRQLTGTKRNQLQENFEEIAENHTTGGFLLTPKYPLNSKALVLLT